METKKVKLRNFGKVSGRIAARIKDEQGRLLAVIMDPEAKLAAEDAAMRRLSVKLKALYVIFNRK
ncbi:MAG: hypothetical protein ACLFUU_12475 [Desulfobacteraceae bacterium]|nr:hypothetical protein [Deltaproteobacteria bacterium]MBW1987598.1 hypothetical protein [Deltaproteobacteria bacterium]MBW2135803.1 hypothetical protein [Deltaproteobacteria bacterium]